MFRRLLSLIETLSKDDPELAIKATGRRRGSTTTHQAQGELGACSAPACSRKMAEQKALQAFIAAERPDGELRHGARRHRRRLRRAEKTREADTALQRKC